MKDLTTYALSYAAVLTAAIAVMGLIASTADPVQAEPAEAQVAAAQPATAHAAATMNIPF